MFIALFDFCLILLLVSFLLYGIREWKNLLIDEEDIPSLPQTQENSGRFFALWVLIVGLGGLSLLTEILEWLNT